MEIKYTLEILTKDIQDIGKLVENLQNSPEGSTLELDLALSKLRNVYDILTLIREDIHRPTQALVQPPKTTAPPPPVVETPIPQPEPTVETPKPQPEPAAETPIPEPEPVAEKTIPEPEPVVETPKAEPEKVEETPKAKAKPAPEKDHTIIAEKFTSESSINENLGGNRETGRDSKLMGQAIDHIGRNIGINDRFLIIRELFDGDSDGFGKLIQDLDNAGNLQSASERLLSQFSEAPEHEGVSILDKLVKRKYS